MSQYTDYRTYAFCCPTDSYVRVTPKKGKKFEAEFTGWPSGLGTGDLPESLVNYVNTMLTQDDMKIRLFRLLNAIEGTVKYENEYVRKNAGTDSDQILRVFVAPEFYFRPAMVSEILGGSYEEKDAEKLMIVLKDYFERYSTWGEGRTPLKNWLFICGTCVFKNGPASAASYILNALLTYTIDKDGVVQSRQILKMAVAKCDMIEPKYNLIGGPVPGLYQSINHMFLEDHYFRELNVFVEICLEHGFGLLTKKGTGYDVELQVISAAGGKLVQDNIPYGATAIMCEGKRWIKKDSMVYGFYKSMIGDDKEIKLTKEVCKVSAPWEDLDKGKEYIKQYYPECESFNVMGISNTTGVLQVCQELYPPTVYTV